MSSELEVIFGELGLAQYLSVFVEQGFDEWDIILDIQESDLDALGVKLGHRRKLQRRIANARGISPSVSLAQPVRPPTEETRSDGAQFEPSRQEVHQEGQSVAKRKYRRHPKPDENAPERPPSAYVLFSNKMREDLRSQNLSFTEIAKLVGENWQNLPPPEKDAFESQANADKEKYHRDLMEYKKTPDYGKYMQYLQEFKEKQAKRTQGADSSKRLKLSTERPRHNSGGSTATPGGNTSASGSETLQGSEPPPCRKERMDSVVSVAESQHSSTTPTMISRANSNDDTMSSPRGHFDAGSPRDPRRHPAPRQSTWRDEGRGSNDNGHSNGSHHQHLPSLLNMLEEGRRALPHSSGSEGNPYSTGFVAANHPRSVPEVSNVLPAPPVRAPLLRHGQSSSSSVDSTSPAPSFARGPGEGPLPIHALLSHQGMPTPAISVAAMFDRGSPNSMGGIASPGLADPARPPFEHGAGRRGYDFHPMPPAHQMARQEQPEDNDVLMASAPDLLASGATRPAKTRFDGMNALLRAGELVERNDRGD